MNDKQRVKGGPRTGALSVPIVSRLPTCTLLWHGNADGFIFAMGQGRKRGRQHTLAS